RVVVLTFLLIVQCHVDRSDPPSFPTRRSSDLLYARRAASHPYRQPGQGGPACGPASRNAQILLLRCPGRWQQPVFEHFARTQPGRGQVHSGQEAMTSISHPLPKSGRPRGFMLVCDGSNGAGKTTLINTLRAYLLERGLDVVVTREPGGTPIGEKIREVLLSPDTPEMCDLTELMLFGASRAQHLREKILPALQAGQVVLCDRFDSATISFQHYARGIDLELVEQINDLALGGFRPDLYIILDLDPAVGLRRVQR